MLRLRNLGWLLLVLMMIAPAGGAASDARLAYPSSMAALGDSYTLASLTEEIEKNSWSTGTSPAVKSQYLRILAANRAIKNRAYNLAEGSARFRDMQQQARAAVAKHVEYVTIWGGEDDCGLDDLMPLERDFDTLLRILARGHPQPKVFVASNRDMSKIYRTLKAHRSAVLKHIPYGVSICGAVLGKNAKLDSPAAQVAEATASIKRVNGMIARICGRYRNCRFDGNAVFDMPIAFSDLAGDYIHISVAGERRVAETTWRATFPFGR